MLKIGITGGIGSGKTTVCRMFELLGVPVYYADDRAKRLMTGHRPLKKEIQRIFFPEEVYFRNGRLNRKKIAGLVFSNRNLLDQLNGVVHPAVGRDYEEWHQRQDAPYTLKEAALLIESGSYRSLDKLIVVAADEDVRIERVVLRDGTDRQAVRNRMKNQLTEEQRLEKADFVLDNSGRQALIPQITELHRTLIKLST